jgi:hypothetical protein
VTAIRPTARLLDLLRPVGGAEDPHGELERTVTWTIGESGTAGGGSGPDRDVVGNEDRVDGRGDG